LKENKSLKQLKTLDLLFFAVVGQAGVLQAGLQATGSAQVLVPA
jgi:hypothetical protein